MGQRITAQLKRHIDILIPLLSAIFGAGVMFAHNNDSIADLNDRVGKTETKVEAIAEVKQDVSAIKQKVDDIWDIMSQKGRR